MSLDRRSGDSLFVGDGRVPPVRAEVYENSASRKAAYAKPESLSVSVRPLANRVALHAYLERWRGQTRHYLGALVGLYYAEHNLGAHIPGVGA